MLSTQGGKTYKLFVLVGIVLSVWILLSWLTVSLITRERTEILVRSELEELNRQSVRLARDVDTSLEFLLGVSELVARDERVLGLLSDAAAPARTEKKAKEEINRYLAKVSASLPADVVWITDTSGNCVAASNAHLPESFVGTNYADRDYFQEAQEGKSGQQYAMGRKTNIPGMFFSAPVMAKGRFIGAVTSKIDLPKLAHLVGQADAFIADENGVIILAHDKSIEMNMLPNAPVAHTSEAVRMARYKKMDFSVLDIASLGRTDFPVLRRLKSETVPLLFSSRVLEGKNLEVHSYRRLPQMDILSKEKLWLFLLLVVTGILLIFGCVWKMSHKYSKSKNVESALLFRSIMESTADGLLVVDSNQKIAAFNQRFVEMWSVPHNLLAAEQTDALIAHVVGRAELSLEALGLLSDILNDPRSSGQEIVRLNDGRLIECLAQSLWLEQRVIGRVWRFRDMTDHRDSKTTMPGVDDAQIKVVAQATSS